MRVKHGLIGAGVALALSVAAGQAAAVPVVSVSGEGAAAASAAETAFLSFLTNTSTESFDLIAVQQAPSFNTAVGTFTQTTPTNKVGGKCNQNGLTCNGGLAVLDSTSSPFSGRFAISPTHWLDSVDSLAMTFTLNTFATSVGFYITDPNDVNGNLSLVLTDGTTANFNLTSLISAPQSNGAEYFVSLYDATGISKIVFNANGNDDGYGIDNVTIGTVPEPASLALMGLGAIGLGLARRKKA